VATAKAFRSGSVALVRAVARSRLNLPPWPDLTQNGLDATSTASQIAWLREVWQATDVAERLMLASPALAWQMRDLCDAPIPSPRDVRRAAISVGRYLLRSEGRATPFGLFAGVTTAGFGTEARADWGTEHWAIASPSAEWLAALIAQLESRPEMLSRLPVVANSSLMIRGDRVLVPYQPKTQERGTGAVEVSLLHTDPVRAALAGASAPIRADDLGAKILADFPAAGPEKVSRLIAELVARRALITSLHAPATETDVLGHLVAQLEAADAESIASVAVVARELRWLRMALGQCNALPASTARAAREDVAARMSALLPVRRHPLAVDLRLDATVSLPEEVAREVERAALALARVSRAPYGTAGWKEYHQRFYERFGIGSMVPLLDVVADSGIGYPDGYPGSATGERRSPVSSRDEALVRLAQSAVLDGRDEVVLDEDLMAALELGPDRVRLPPHLEVGVRVYADSTKDLQRGDFRLEVVSVSRGAGVGSGRFLRVLEPEGRAALAAELADLPGTDADTVAVQLSFPPLVAETAHVTRSPQILPTVISLEEHRAPDEHVLSVEDLAVGCDGRRMYLAVPKLGKRVEAVGMNALNLRTHTPPLARFLIELSRAQCAAVTLFDWGAARTMPFLPRVRYGRTILAPARWRLETKELPVRTQPWADWDSAFTEWRARRRLPQRVYVTEGDRLLSLDLDQVGHRVLLRNHVDRDVAVLTEATLRAGWCGERAHEVVVPLKAVESPGWPRLPKPTRDRIIRRDQGQTPGTSLVLLASIYGDIRRQDTLLAQHLPDLAARLDEPPWWYVRFRDPDQHLRLRIALSTPEEFWRVAHTVSTWADELHRAGLLREVRYPTSYPETGRWGDGPAWTAAEDVFRADSRALLTQLRQPARPDRRALVAAHTVAIACAFHGDTATGMRWLIDHIPPTAPQAVPRHQFNEAVRIADPRNDWAALRAAPGGNAIADAWAERASAVTAYRGHVPGPHTRGIDADDVLGSLLHVHFVRAVAVDFPEESVCLYLARAAALAWTARTTGRPA
jgi:lantibiotic biosynthesis protein